VTVSSPLVRLRWRPWSTVEGQTDFAFPPDAGFDDIDQVGRKSLRSAPIDSAPEIYCAVRHGEEERLAALLQRVLELLPDRAHQIPRWSLNTTSNGYQLRRLDQLLSVLPAVDSIEIRGDVATVIRALAASPAHWGALKSLELRACGSSFTSLSSLASAPSLERVEIAGANNVAPPWTEAVWESGFGALNEIVITDTPSLQQYKPWVSATTSTGRVLPVVTIGAVQLPNGADEQLELGQHLRFDMKDLQFAIEHWLKLAPTFISFTAAVAREAREFKLPPRCTAPELAAILLHESTVSHIDCSECTRLVNWKVTEWLPAQFGLDFAAAEVKLTIPSLLEWGVGDRQEIAQPCERFVDLLERIALKRAGAVRVVIRGRASVALQAWMWLLEASGSQLRLSMPDVELSAPMFADQRFIVDLGEPAHQMLCRLIMKRGVRAQAIDGLIVRGRIAESDIDLMARMLGAVPDLKLSIDGNCDQSAEWAIGGFARRNRERVELSDAIKQMIVKLDPERRKFEEASNWALGRDVE
jgi:hypothetical protein